MNRNAFTTVLTVLAVVLFLATSVSFAEESNIHGHISYVEGGAFVVKPAQDKTLDAALNLPLVPGDIVYTDSKGRCELQFDNGTIIRLDRDTEIKLDTVRSQGLTTKSLITTLQLKKGHIYTKNQVYLKEIFQVVTPNASVKMMQRSTNSILVNENGETYVNAERGKVGIMYGADEKALKTEYVKSNKAAMVGADHKLKTENTEKNPEFLVWNKKIDSEFKDLHYGKSKVPGVIYRRSPGIVKFAEKWSTRFGEWSYNDLFGYVWKPFNETFDGRRPFWDANYVKINNELVLVPNQSWGWAPAHLGTWFWSKKDGWIWIPGNAFSAGICSVGLVGMVHEGDHNELRRYAFGTFGHWLYEIFGSLDLYNVYLTRGANAWRSSFKATFNVAPSTRKPPVNQAPENIRRILRTMNKAPRSVVEKHLASDRTRPEVKVSKKHFINGFKTDKTKSAFVAEHKLRVNKADIGKGKVMPLVAHARDWNPDSKWARKVGVEIKYSSNRNAVVAPKYNLSSDKMNDIRRTMLRRSVVNRNILNHATVTTGGHYRPSNYTTSSSSRTTGGGSAGASRSGTSGGSGSGGGESKK